MRTQIKIKSRYSSHNIASGYNMNNNHPFLVHTNSNVHQQNKNLMLHHPSTFSTLARANSNKLCHSSNSLLNNILNIIIDKIDVLRYNRHKLNITRRLKQC